MFYTFICKQILKDQDLKGFVLLVLFVFEVRDTF
jgi:hypothetical protein